MATGYGTYSETEYTAHTDNMAIAAVDWIPAIFNERPDIRNYVPQAWAVPVVWNDLHNQIPKTLLLTGMTLDNTDYGKLYGVMGASVFTLYKDSDKTLSVASVDATNGFLALNSSGLVADDDFEWDFPDSPVADTGIILKYTTLEMEMESKRADVADRMIGLLAAHSENPTRKPEYLKRIHDKTQFGHAEIFCFLQMFFRMQNDGNPESAKSVLQNMYQGLLNDELARPVAWDYNISVDEDSTTVVYKCGGGSIGIDFL
jgi:hypothetical protein